MKPLIFFLGILFFASCVSEPAPPFSKEKISSYYADYFILIEQLDQNLLKKDSLTEGDITKYALKKNKLTVADLEKINIFYDANPKSFNPILKNIVVKVDSIFWTKK